MIDLSTLIRAFSFDLAAAFVLGSAHSDCYMDQPEFGRAKLQRFRGVFRLVELVKHFPILRSSHLLGLVPDAFKGQLTPLELYKRVSVRSRST